MPTTTKTPRRAAAFSPGRRARSALGRSPYPWRRRRRGLGRGLPGPRQQLPSDAQRPPRRQRSGPRRPTALPAAGGRPGGPAAPRVGRGPRSLRRAAERAFAEPLGPADPKERKRCAKETSGLWGRRAAPCADHGVAKAAWPRRCEPRANLFVHRVPLGFI